MTCYYLDLYSDFTCLAGRCPSTCCAGWKIVVDQAAKRRFEELDREELRRDILEHILEKDGEYRFENRADGSCSMLDTDGLCRIQRQLDEEALCNTCRKFPRLTARVDKDIWLSMAASCPVVAAYLWSRKAGWVRQEKNRERNVVDWQIFQPVAEGMALYRKYCERVGEQRQQHCRDLGGKRESAAIRENWYRFELFLDLADGCLEIMSEFREQTYLEGSFTYFEQEDREVLDILNDMEEFAAVWQKDFFHFADNYLPYRLFGRYLEYQDEDANHRYCQVMGELSLLYLILFSRYHTWNMTEKDIVEVINWVYRFCVHGVHSSGKVSELFSSVFESPESYIRFITSTP